jgi:hypothetical protein
MILVNGIPKSGTHALLKGVELLGIPASNITLDHLPFGPLPENTEKHIFIIRHPRNIIISYCRWINKPVTTGMLIGCIQDFQEKHFADYCNDFIPWLTDTDTYVIKYEDLCISDTALRSVANYLEIPYLEDAFPNLPGLTATWTGSPSDWTTIWNDEIDAEWQLRCQEIQDKMVY